MSEDKVREASDRTVRRHSRDIVYPTALDDIQPTPNQAASMPPPPTDSGYASTSRDSKNVTHPASNDADEIATIRSSAEILEIPADIKDLLVSAFAQKLLADVGSIQMNTDLACAMMELLPANLKEFSIMLAASASEKAHREATSFVRQNRR